MTAMENTVNMSSTAPWIQPLTQIKVAKSTLALTVLAIWAVGFFSRCFYNIYLHPLRKIPGPRLAAMTFWPDFYWDVVKDGSYLFEIRKMHDKYGPIVRITPNEVHINDPGFYGTVYSSGSSKVNKDPSTVVGFGHPGALASTVDHDQHKARRGYLSHRYSKRAINEMLPLLTDRLDALCERLDGALESGGRISLDRAFSAMAADIIYAQIFGEHLDYLSDPALRVPWRDAFIGLSSTFHTSRFIANLLRRLKKPLFGTLLKPISRLVSGPLVTELFELQSQTTQAVQRIVDTDNPDDPAIKSVIVEVLNNPEIPHYDRTMERLIDDGILFGFAGTETTSRSMAVGTYYLLNDKPVLAKLRDELATAVEESPNKELTLAELERLPYLTGVVKEAIRLSFGPVSRLPRIHTQETLSYGDFILPAGYPVSMSTLFLNVHPKTFPDPWKFSPDRWVEAAQRGFPLTNYLGSFSKGTRACIGINLSYAELYLVFSRVPTRFDMELVDTTFRDVSVEQAYIIGYPRLKTGRTNGEAEVKVMVTRKLET